jgi:hypothetical protein
MKSASERVKLGQRALIGKTGAEILSAYPMEEAMLLRRFTRRWKPQSSILLWAKDSTARYRW